MLNQINYCYSVPEAHTSRVCPSSSSHQTSWRCRLRRGGGGDCCHTTWRSAVCLHTSGRSSSGWFLWSLQVVSACRKTGCSLWSCLTRWHSPGGMPSAGRRTGRRCKTDASSLSWSRWKNKRESGYFLSYMALTCPASYEMWMKKFHVVMRNVLLNMSSSIGVALMI